MPPKIKTISIRAFRGIRELDIPLEGKSLVLQGENGTGKSSITEALEFFFTGTVSHLEGSHGISPERHAPHVEFDISDVSVTLALDPGNVSLTRTFSDPPLAPRNIAAYLDAGQTGSFMLRRAQLLSFIESRPADRFRALASIIGIEELDQIELEMVRARDDLEGELAASKSAVAARLRALASELKSDISSLADVLPALNHLLEELHLPRLRSLEEIDAHAEELLRAVKSSESVEASSSLSAALSQAKAQPPLDSILQDVSDFNRRSEELHEEGAATAVRLMGVLSSSRQIITEFSLEECPVCERQIDRDEVVDNLARRMSTLQALTAEASQVRTIAAAIRSTIEAFAGNVQQLSALVHHDLAAQVPSLGRILDASLFRDGLPQLAASAELEVPHPLPELPGQIHEASSLAASLRAELEAAIARLAVSDQEKAMLAAVRLMEAVKNMVTGLAGASTRQDILAKRLSTARQVCDSFSAAKREKIDEIYEGIQQDVRRYYTMLHPDEPQAEVTLALSASRRASTELRIRSFGGDAEDPRALCSEGHLDSLGLCIFLAFVKRFSGECTLIVLDDVITAIDASHRRKICDLLFEEFQDHQLVITTHDPLWYLELQAAQRAYGVGPRFLNMQILQWDIEGGPTTSTFFPQPDHIRLRLEAGDRKAAGNESRQYLEWLVKEIVESTNASVPVNEWKRPTAGGVTPCARNRLVGLVRDPTLRDSINAAFSRLERTALFGNLLSHDNILADQVSLDEIREFFEAISDIHGLVACAGCGSVLVYVKNVDELRCIARSCPSKTIIPTR